MSCIWLFQFLSQSVHCKKNQICSFYKMILAAVVTRILYILYIYWKHVNPFTEQTVYFTVQNLQTRTFECKPVNSTTHTVTKICFVTLTQSIMTTTVIMQVGTPHEESTFITSSFFKSYTLIQKMHRVILTNTKHC